MHQALSPILQGCCSKRITHQCDTTISQGWKMVAKSRLRSAGAFRYNNIDRPNFRAGCQTRGRL
ncbi:hypothetical protein M752DRAFT_36670 [Aspergillus phoenicis ATCC 13157]|uniref:Uncharacterized protein n=1 Tax=Aspergillus phoenicis ATCC 13157 TaxID=1353007 RepID=A0A370PEV4_ASPPH|nr:hypothetical protein M752DRAFT_36670 [Aspergillus phoenicis ATCC 13157]